MSVTKRLVAAVIILALTGCRSAAPTGSPAPATESASPTAPAVEVTSQPANTKLLTDYPVIPTVSAHARELYQAALANGRNPQVFSKVGNCMTASPDYLAPFSTGSYDLGQYGSLRPTIDYYQSVSVREVDGKKLDSFSNPSLAAASGFTSAGPLDQIWADPSFCNAGETPLDCEYRVSNPSMTLILFGTNDVYYLDTAKFEGYMRAIIDETVKQNVMPVLITFPPLPDRLDQTEKFNQIVAHLAAEYDIPLVNLWLALDDKPGYGVNPDHFTSLTTPADGCAVCFTDTNLQSGIATENLVMLQALDALRKGLSS